MVELREQGTQHRLIVGINAIYSLSAKMEARRLIEERKAKRKARGK